MDWNKLKFTKLENEALDFLFRNPTRAFNGKELADSLKVSQTAVAKSIRNLAKIGLIKVEKKLVLSIGLNREDKDIFVLKRIFNIKEMYSSGLVRKLSEEFSGASIILFGSYSNGEDSEESDIDIAVIGYKESKLNLQNFEERLQRKIEIHFFKKIGEAHKDLRENILNGIVLEGAIKL